MQKTNDKAKLFKTASPEDAGYDIWGIFPNPITMLLPGDTLMVETGIKTEFSKDLVGRVWERGSTGVINLQVRAGVVDSNYRGEWKVILSNGNADASIFFLEGEVDSVLYDSHKQSILNAYRLGRSGEVEFKIEEQKLTVRNEDSTSILAYFYPQEKAIAQVCFLKIEKPEIVESTEDLASSNRGEGSFGSSGH